MSGSEASSASDPFLQAGAEFRMRQDEQVVVADAGEHDARGFEGIHASADDLADARGVDGRIVRTRLGPGLVEGGAHVLRELEDVGGDEAGQYTDAPMLAWRHPAPSAGSPSCR